jgi:hypothetical protein
VTDAWDEDVAAAKADLQRFLDPFWFNTEHHGWVLAEAMREIADEMDEAGDSLQEVHETDEKFEEIVSRLDEE